jgi:hypothetical protein
MDLKSAGIGEGAQHVSSFYNVLDSAAVVLLIEEVAGFLTIFYVYVEL